MDNILNSLTRCSNARTRSITAENVYGEPGKGGMAEVSETPQPEVLRIGQEWGGPNLCARELGQKWKVRPCISLPPASETTLMDVKGPGCIRHIWLTLDTKWHRELILRMYWDDETEPSVEVPIGDFFCCAPKYDAEIRSLAVAVNPSHGMNMYLPMPFGKRARITVENLHPENKVQHLFYTIDYEEQDSLPEDTVYFHAAFQRRNPLKYGEDFPVLPQVRGRGHFAGCYLTWQQNNNGWWGEGEVKMYFDGDREFPTICGTGTEDYFGGAWCYGKTYTGLYTGYPFGGENKTGARHSMYRFHLTDPVHFKQEFRMDIQAIGWREGGRYLPLQDDISATAYWYQQEPHASFTPLPDRNGLEII